MTQITDNARTVLERRISIKDEEGEPLETAEDIFIRVASNIALAEANYCKSEDEFAQKAAIAEKKFYTLMSNLDFLPNSPTLVNAGNELQQLSACFVIPVEDSMENIFEAVKQAALIHKTGGGTGFSFSRLRPENSTVSATSGIASGPVSFMQVFDKATEVIKQGGTRRGANMGILRIDHPDILSFIHVKDGKDSLSNFNISVAITDTFMEKVEHDQDYDLVDPKTNGVVQRISARKVWGEIIESAWKTGDPGVVFIDRINASKANPVPGRGPIESTNPCGEQPLYPWDSCNLGSINLANFVEDGKVDYPRLQEVIHDSVHFLDNVIDMNKWPNDKIAEVSMAIRRIGLGVMGWADMLIKMGVPYDSSEACYLAEQLSSFIQREADAASRKLAVERGPFPEWDKSIYKDDGIIRNATRTTIAPTGTISIIAGCSSGIEPVFALEFKRSHYLDKDPNKRHEMDEVHPELKNWREVNGSSPIPSYFRSAMEIDAKWHIAHQSAWQKNTDNAVSKTINLPSAATVEDVRSVYDLAWISGCKGVTIYRDGSKEQQVLFTEQTTAKEALEARPAPIRRKLPKERNSITHRVDLGETETFITVGLYEEGTPGEVFIVANRVGSSTRGYLDSFATMLSYALQYGVPLERICDKLIATRFEPSGFTGNPDIPVATSIIDYIARWLRRRFTENHDNAEYISRPTGDMCPECSSAMFYGEGCTTCASCGYSKCG